MELRGMTIDEYAELQERVGSKLRKVDGLWWRRVRPFFYRPLHPLKRILPRSTRVPIAGLIGACQHAVSSPWLGNSHMNFFVFDRIQSYSKEELGYNYRKNLRKAMRELKVKKIDDLERFVREGHPVYLSFCQRTRYQWRKDRIDVRVFHKWASTLFDFPQVLTIGAYKDDVLSAVSVICLLEDLVLYETFFAGTESLRLRVSELMLHTVRQIALGCSQAKYVFMGNMGKKASLDDFKIARGCKILCEPAYLAINPVVKLLLRKCKQGEYGRLVGMGPEEARVRFGERSVRAFEDGDQSSVGPCVGRLR